MGVSMNINIIFQYAGNTANTLNESKYLGNVNFTENQNKYIYGDNITDIGKEYIRVICSKSKDTLDGPDKLVVEPNGYPLYFIEYKLNNDTLGTSLTNEIDLNTTTFTNQQSGTLNIYLGIPNDIIWDFDETQNIITVLINTDCKPYNNEYNNWIKSDKTQTFTDYINTNILNRSSIPYTLIKGINLTENEVTIDKIGSNEYIKIKYNSYNYGSYNITYLTSVIDITTILNKNTNIITNLTESLNIDTKNYNINKIISTTRTKTIGTTYQTITRTPDTIEQYNFNAKIDTTSAYRAVSMNIMRINSLLASINFDNNNGITYNIQDKDEFDVDSYTTPLPFTYEECLNKIYISDYEIYQKADDSSGKIKYYITFYLQFSEPAYYVTLRYIYKYKSRFIDENDTNYIDELLNFTNTENYDGYGKLNDTDKLINIKEGDKKYGNFIGKSSNIPEFNDDLYLLSFTDIWETETDNNNKEKINVTYSLRNYLHENTADYQTVTIVNYSSSTTTAETYITLDYDLISTLQTDEDGYILVPLFIRAYNGPLLISFISHDQDSDISTSDKNLYANAMFDLNDNYVDENIDNIKTNYHEHWNSKTDCKVRNNNNQLNVDNTKIRLDFKIKDKADGYGILENILDEDNNIIHNKSVSFIDNIIAYSKNNMTGFERESGITLSSILKDKNGSPLSNGASRYKFHNTDEKQYTIDSGSNKKCYCGKYGLVRSGYDNSILLLEGETIYFRVQPVKTSNITETNKNTIHAWNNYEIISSAESNGLGDLIENDNISKQYYQEKNEANCKYGYKCNLSDNGINMLTNSKTFVTNQYNKLVDLIERYQNHPFNASIKIQRVNINKDAYSNITSVTEDTGNSKAFAVIGGNVMSLLFSDMNECYGVINSQKYQNELDPSDNNNSTSIKHLLKQCHFGHLFANQTLIYGNPCVTPSLYLLNTDNSRTYKVNEYSTKAIIVNSSYCYYNMFKGCENIIINTSLKSFTVPEHAYESMFEGCKSICGQVLALINDDKYKYGTEEYNKLFRTYQTLQPVKGKKIFDYAYANMFKNCTSITSNKNLYLKQINKIGIGIFKSMFEGCTSLKSTITISLDKSYDMNSDSEYDDVFVTKECCKAMFKNCTSLNNVDYIEWLTIDNRVNADNAFESMFEGCTNLTNISSGNFYNIFRKNYNLSNAKLCYKSMFKNSGIEYLSKLLYCTESSDNCFEEMFMNCTQLRNVASNILENITLTNKNECINMFSGCTSLETVSFILPYKEYKGTTDETFKGLLSGCTSLKTVNADIFDRYKQNYNTSSMFKGIFKGCTSLETSPNIYIGSSEMFMGCSSLSEIKFLYNENVTDSKKITEISNTSEIQNIANKVFDKCDNWVKGVNNTGKFKINIDQNWINTENTDAIAYYKDNNNKIPINWSIDSNIANTLGYLKFKFNGAKVDFKFYVDESVTENIPKFKYKKCITEEDEVTVEWTDLQNNEIISFTENSYILIYGNNTSLQQISSDKFHFDIKGGFVKVEGCLYSLVSNVVYKTGQTINTGHDYLFSYLFYNCTAINDIDDLYLGINTSNSNYILHRTFYNCTGIHRINEKIFTYVRYEDNGDKIFSDISTLGKGCFNGMFENCTNLTTISNNIFKYTDIESHKCMFKSCTSLENVPNLNATALKESCYESMFEGCINIHDISKLPKLNIANLAIGCYKNMFKNCINLEHMPELISNPTLAESCYEGMFNGCTNLKHYGNSDNNYLVVLANDTSGYTNTFLFCLSATQLAKNCYKYMFANTNIISSPHLYSSNLVNGCYEGMFSNCYNLEHIFVDNINNISSLCDNYTKNWVENVPENLWEFNDGQWTAPSDNLDAPQRQFHWQGILTGDSDNYWASEFNNWTLIPKNWVSIGEPLKQLIDLVVYYIS